jgi:hypothetical protein
LGGPGAPDLTPFPLCRIQGASGLCSPSVCREAVLPLAGQPAEWLDAPSEQRTEESRQGGRGHQPSGWPGIALAGRRSAEDCVSEPKRRSDRGTRAPPGIGGGARRLSLRRVLGLAHGQSSRDVLAGGARVTAERTLQAGILAPRDRLDRRLRPRPAQRPRGPLITWWEVRRAMKD